MHICTVLSQKRKEIVIVFIKYKTYHIIIHYHLRTENKFLLVHVNKQTKFTFSFKCKMIQTFNLYNSL